MTCTGTVPLRQQLDPDAGRGRLECASGVVRLASDDAEVLCERVTAAVRRMLAAQYVTLHDIGWDAREVNQ